VGKRPGEKLHEQLWREDALVTATQFRNVFQVKAAPVLASFPKFLAELEQAARMRQSDSAIQQLLYRLPIDYSPEGAELAPMAIAN
jgi:FlaA1/EpsC-like NDP-sugar epimerase